MLRIFDGFRDPARRPRFIIWSGMALILVVVIWAVALIGTSFAWFCTTPCHKVHDDNTLAYKASSHSNVACVSCHEPLHASPARYTFMKIYVLPDLYSTVTNTFELPMNANNATAVDMPAKQCTQCHNLANRTVTPSAGIIIDHDAHSSRGITCTTCHNRVAHPEENVTFILKGDRKHDDWMKMDACFRCHGQAPGSKAPGTCSTCHPADFKLKPASHDAAGWYAKFGESGGHAKAAKEESASVAEATRLHEEAEPLNPKKAQGPILAPSSTVNTCFTCHKTTFCSDCHGVAIPHPEAFKKSHGATGFASPAVCAKCHARTPAEANGTAFCNACHHKDSTPDQPWLTQHPESVKKNGAQPCFKCHDEAICSGCHVRGVAAGRAALRQAAGY